MTTILGAIDTRAALPFDRLVDALREAVVELADGRIRCPERLVVPLEGGTTLLSMPAVASDLAIHKLITVAPRNAAVGLPAILGSVTVLDPSTGYVRLVLDGPTVTGRRTAALSLLAVAALGRGWVRRALVIGTGVQAQHHVDAITALHPEAELRVRGRGDASAEAFCRSNARHPGGVAVAGAAEDFDVVFTCTTSRTPVYAEVARAGTLLVAVGSYRPECAEIGPATVRASAVWVDDLQAARHEAGDLIQAGVKWDDVASLADTLRDGGGEARPRLFKSVGCAAWDLAAARVALEVFGR